MANKSKCVQTEDYLNILLGERRDFGAEFPLTHNFFNKEKRKSKILVDYEVSDSNSSDENDSQCGQVILSDNLQSLKVINDIIETLITPKIVSVENQGFISEITERKNSQKRKSDGTESNSSKTYKTETGNKRKCTKPKKLDKSVSNNNHMNEATTIKKEIDSDDFGEENYGQVERTSTDEDQSVSVFVIIFNIHFSTIHFRIFYPNAVFSAIPS